MLIRTFPIITISASLLILSGCSGKQGLLSSAGEQRSDDVYFVEKDTTLSAASEVTQEAKANKAEDDYYDPKVAADIRTESLRNRDEILFTPLGRGLSEREWQSGHHFRLNGPFGSAIGPKYLNTDRAWYYTRHLKDQRSISGKPFNGKKGPNNDEDRRTYEYGSGGDASGVDFGTDGDPSNSNSDDNSSSTGNGRRSSNDGGDTGSGRRR